MCGFVNVLRSWPTLKSVKVALFALSEVASVTRLVAVTGCAATLPARVMSVTGPTGVATVTDWQRFTSYATY